MIESEYEHNKIAHRAGFCVSVGNWITPDGGLILGKEGTTHQNTLEEYLGHTSEDSNHLAWMTQKIAKENFIRVVFRQNVWFNMGGDNHHIIWSNLPHVCRMLEILQYIPDIEVHVFSSKFTVVAWQADDILKRNEDKLHIIYRSKEKPHESRENNADN